MNPIKLVFDLIREHANGNISSLINAFMSNAYKDEEIRHAGGKCFTHNEYIQLISKMENQLRAGNSPSLDPEAPVAESKIATVSLGESDEGVVN